MITAQGIGSGLDVASIVSQLVVAEGQPATLRLATREAGIQAELSALGSLKSALSSFRDALSGLSDVDVFRSRTATSEDTDIFSVSAGTSAVPSSYDVEVLAIATAQKLSSQAFEDPGDKALGAGTLTIQSGPDADTDSFQISIDEDASTLEDIRDAINDSEDNSAVRASIVNAEDGARLIVSSTRTGEDYEISITAGEDGGLDFLSYGADAAPGSTMTELRAAEDARILVDTFERTSSSNAFTDVIEGVTITTRGADPGTTYTLDVAFDTGSASAKATEFTEAYNSLVDELNGLQSYDADSGIAGALLGDRSVREVASALRLAIAGGDQLSDGSYRSLTRAGITTDLDGKLSIDTTELNTALTEDFDSIARLFGDEDGFATRLDEVLDPYLESGGRLDTRTDGLQTSIDLIEDQRVALDLRLESVEARLLSQFSALDSIVSTLSATSDFLATQLTTVTQS
ncbi:MAG: flagellar filament capping protein FliD [Gammaproteobacteria bacterium]